MLFDDYFSLTVTFLINAVKTYFCVVFHRRFSCCAYMLCVCVCVLYYSDRSTINLLAYRPKSESINILPTPLTPFRYTLSTNREAQEAQELIMVAQYYVHYLDASCHKANIRSERFPIRPLLCVRLCAWIGSQPDQLIRISISMNKFFFNLRWVKTASPQIHLKTIEIGFSFLIGAAATNTVTAFCWICPINSMYEKMYTIRG